MSSKTTLALALLVAVAAFAYWFVNRDEAPLDPNERRFFPGMEASDATALRFEGGEADGLVLERRGDGFVVVERGGDDVRRAKRERVDGALRALTSGAWLKPRPDAVDEKGFGFDAATRRAVVVKTKDGAERRFEVGAQVREGIVVARLDGRKTPVEVDVVVVDDVFRAPSDWADRRLVGLDAFDVGEVRVFDRAGEEPGYLLARESGRWLVREPELVRAEQSVVDRLVALACAAEAPDRWRGSTPEATILRATFTSRTRNGEVSIAFGRADAAAVPARVEPNGPWMTAGRDFFDLLNVPSSTFRSRQIADVEARFVTEIVLTRPNGLVETYVRRQDGFVFIAPPDFGWRTPSFLLRDEVAPESRPVEPFLLDPGEAVRLVEGAVGVQSSESGVPAPPDFQPEIEVLVRASLDGTGARTFERRFAFGADRDGRRRTRLPEGGFADVRTADVEFLFTPFYRRLARSIGGTLPHCVVEVEVRDAAGRSASLKAVGVEDGKFVYEKRSSERPDAVRRATAADTEGLRSKLAAMTVSEFLAFGAVQEHGLDAPAYVVRFKDSIQRSEAEPDVEARGGWIEWRIGAERTGGGRFGVVDTRPGLVFAVERKDLDPILDLLYH